MEAVNKAVGGPRARRAGRAYLILAVVAVLVAGAWYAHRWWTAGKRSTDNAQVEADVVPIAARVGGVVLATKVHDNQRVAKGDVLFEIDPANLEVEVQRADAELEAAREQTAVADAQVGIVEQSSTGGLSSAKAALAGAGASVRSAAAAARAAEAAVAQAKANLAVATNERASAQQLFAQSAITRSELDHTVRAHDVAKAALDAATAQLDLSRAQGGIAAARVAEAEGRVTQTGPVDKQVAAARAAAKLAAARVKSAETALAQAKLNRSYAAVVAPTSGMISRLGAHAGQTVQAGQALLMLVPDETYVIANFKESQIGDMKPGDKVDIEVDAYGGTFDGVVDTIAPATGARFSLIPVDNATGNFVKVVQRVPVKIRWAKAPEVAMRPGLSAEVTVYLTP
ncbi:MAG: HlyD family secretion protein [Deltaproteobacteria bacterium]|nr:HlyD family secretion protein [Deltaproteobacteria bacterium]